MAAPTLSGTGGFNNTAEVTTSSPPLPYVIPGELGVLVARLVVKAPGAHSCSTPGWTKVDQLDTPIQGASLWIASQSADPPVFTWPTEARSVVVVTYFVDDEGEQLDGAAVGAVSSVTASWGDPISHPGITATKGNSLFVYTLAIGDTNTSTPAGWTEHFDVGSSYGGGVSIGYRPSAGLGDTSGPVVSYADLGWAGYANDYVATVYEVIRYSEPPEPPPNTSRHRRTILIN